MKTEFLTPVGRLVQGDVFEAQTKNMQGQPLMTQSGQPTQRYFIAVAFAKTDQAFGAFYTLLQQTARASFPTLFDAAGNCTHPRFSWKLVDGDSVDDNGKPNKNKEGFAGHWVVKFASSFAPRAFHAGRYAPHEQIQDPKAIPRGYFVRVAGTIEGNGQPQKPGLYVNLGMVELAGQGPIISSGPEASAVFGAAAPALPAGATPLPMAGGAAPLGLPGMASALPPAVPTLSTPPMNVGMASAPVAAMALPTLPVMPNPAFLAAPAGTAAPQVPGLPTPAGGPAIGAMPASPSSPVMTAAAGGFTYAQYIAQGWTDAALREKGLML